MMVEILGHFENAFELYVGNKADSHPMVRQAVRNLHTLFAVFRRQLPDKNLAGPDAVDLLLALLFRHRVKVEELPWRGEVPLHAGFGEIYVMFEGACGARFQFGRSEPRHQRKGSDSQDEQQCTAARRHRMPTFSAMPRLKRR